MLRATSSADACSQKILIQLIKFSDWKYLKALETIIRTHFCDPWIRRLFSAQFKTDQYLFGLNIIQALTIFCKRSATW